MKVTSLSDIAGRLTRKSRNADRVTVGGVCVLSDATNFIRDKIPAGHPKWRDATDADVCVILNLLLRESLSCTATSVDKSPTAWMKFWDDANQTKAGTASLLGGAISFVKAAAVLKYVLFGQSTTMATTHAIKTGSISWQPHQQEMLAIQETLVFDNEIEGKDNIEMFKQMWTARDAHQPLSHSLGIHREIIDLKLLTEQQEPLLLLPDYVAGIAHCFHSNADTLEASRVSKTAARAAYAQLKESKKYAESVDTFDLSYYDIFPLFRQFEKDRSP